MQLVGITKNRVSKTLQELHVHAIQVYSQHHQGTNTLPGVAKYLFNTITTETP